MLIDYDCEETRRTAIDLVGVEGHLLVANKAESAFEFAKQHQPAHIVVRQSQAKGDGKFLPEVLLEFSPQAEIVLVCDDEFRVALHSGTRCNYLGTESMIQVWNRKLTS